MILRKLKLRDYRSYASLDLDFAPGLTVIEGDNAVGKTNLAEAVQYLSLARSFRLADDEALIRQGCKAALIEGEIQQGPLYRTIRIELGKEGKRVFLNGKPLHRLSELSSLANAIVFSPSDVALFKGPPQARRTFLDVSVGKEDPSYFSHLSAYAKVLRERNALLKEENPDLALLDVLTAQLVAEAEPIAEARQSYVKRLNEALPTLLLRLHGEATEVKIAYRPFVNPAPDYREKALRAFEKQRAWELEHRSTSAGIQREDFTLTLNGKDIALYGSQGENRMAALSLKLCPFYLVKEAEKKPICVLDDVTSELDEGRTKRLFEVLKKDFAQVFVTATKLDIAGASYVDVTPNKAIRRNENYGR
ncbi:MAG: DNA replication/repair protein RecF [Bacilli bacterium]|nr:DNA replication/repair protein RecF [Bacilli bacterium]